ncbi:hypothetical protein COU57_00050 [Candidatus Pacearchaeota archaeon CG10_big_fil_rev_8_21_14_0_10_32_14]|nr:MAG: hypothetical protein COU57_00050 [Candidatus Pacearchaeota archaeon CG10_big_fil_rev_8_21_14_0_10_32_14]
MAKIIKLPFIGFIMISEGKINTAKEIYSKLRKWNVANSTLTNYFNKNPKNDNADIVLIKVILIDSLYKSNLKNQIDVAEHIIKIKNLDELLKQGSPLAVEKISNCVGKNLLSFASKFGHFHNKNKYPIYDKYVCIALNKLNGWKDNRTFSNFLEGIEKFRKENSLTGVNFEDIDKYLWLYGLLLRLNSGKKDVNKEIYTFYMDNKLKFERLLN